MPQDLTVVPQALRLRAKAFTLEDGNVVTVEKWSLQKTIQVVDFVLSSFSSDTSELEDLLKGNAGSIARSIVQRMGGRVSGFIELSVRSEDRPKLQNISFEDALDLMDIILKVNASEAILKKVSELQAQVRFVWGKVKTPTPSKQPSGSSAETE